MAQSAAREPGSGRGWLLVPSRLLLGFWRSPPVAQPQPQLQQLPPHLQRTPAAESRSPRARAAGPALWLPARPVTPITPSLPPGARARQGRVEDTGSQGCARAETAEGKVRVGAGDR